MYFYMKISFDPLRIQAGISLDRRTLEDDQKIIYN